MNTFRKLKDGTWGVVCGVQSQPGEVVTITTKSGAVKRETLGAFVEVDRFSGWQIFRIARTAPTTSEVGNMSGVLALFAKAKTHLKFPAVVLSVPAAEMSVRLSVAGARAKVPGSITVLTHSKNAEGQRDWIGRITTDGQFTCSPRVNGKEAAITARLQEFANDPARVASEHGKLTAVCCFCNHPLGQGKDKRSIEVGYGPDCAEHFGLPWGK